MKTGFIGMGNMAQALCAGFISAGTVDKKDIFAYAPHRDRLFLNAKKLGFTPCSSLHELAASSDMLIMCCKPYQIESVLAEIYSDISGKALISIASGWSLKKYILCLNTISKKMNDDDAPNPAESIRIQAIMPNTPVMVRDGVFLLEAENTLLEEERKELIDMLSPLGLVHELPSALMGIGGAVTGCFPAFADMFIEAYADAAVKYGMSRADAYALISKAMSGSAKLVLESGLHPGVLKDQVCSPAGTTIRGVQALEDHGLRSACMASIDAIMQSR